MPRHSADHLVGTGRQVGVDATLLQRWDVEVDVRALVAEALRLGREKQPALSANVDDYAIYNFSIGFEGMGHWETTAEISNMSLMGTAGKTTTP